MIPYVQMAEWNVQWVVHVNSFKHRRLTDECPQRMDLGHHIYTSVVLIMFIDRAKQCSLEVLIFLRRNESYYRSTNRLPGGF